MLFLEQFDLSGIIPKQEQVVYPAYDLKNVKQFTFNQKISTKNFAFAGT